MLSNSGETSSLLGTIQFINPCLPGQCWVYDGQQHSHLSHLLLYADHALLKVAADSAHKLPEAPERLRTQHDVHDVNASQVES